MQKYIPLFYVGAFILVVGASAYFTHQYDVSQLDNNLAHASSGTYDTTRTAQKPIVLPPEHHIQVGRSIPADKKTIDSLRNALSEWIQLDSLKDEAMAEYDFLASPFVAEFDEPNYTLVDSVYPLTKQIKADIQFNPLYPPDSTLNIAHIEYVEKPIAWYAQPYFTIPVTAVIVYFLAHSSH